MIDLMPISSILLGIAYRERTRPRHAEMLKALAVRLRNAHDVLQKVTGGLAARQQNRSFWAGLHKQGVPTAEVSASPRLPHPAEAFGTKPTPRAIRYLIETMRNDFEPRGIPYSELLALRRFLEAQLEAP